MKRRRYFTYRSKETPYPSKEPGGRRCSALPLSAQQDINQFMPIYVKLTHNRAVTDDERPSTRNSSKLKQLRFKPFDRTSALLPKTSSLGPQRAISRVKTVEASSLPAKSLIPHPPERNKQASRPSRSLRERYKSKPSKVKGSLTGIVEWFLEEQIRLLIC